MTTRCPPFTARDYKGETKRGTDGNMYKSTRDKNGHHRWKRIFRITSALIKSTFKEEASGYQLSSDAVQFLLDSKIKDENELIKILRKAKRITGNERKAKTTSKEDVAAAIQKLKQGKNTIRSKKTNKRK